MFQRAGRTYVREPGVALSVCKLQPAIACAVTAAACLTAASVSPCRAAVPEPRPSRVDAVTAYVNDHVITVSEVMVAMEGLRRRLMNEVSDQQALRAKLRESFDETRRMLVDRKLMLDAFKAEGEEAKIPDWAVERQMQESVRESFGGDPRRLQQALREEGMTMEEWRKSIRERLMVTSLRSAKITANIRVPMREVYEAYGHDRDRFTTPERIRLRMLSVPKGAGTDAAARADVERARDRFMAGRAFAEAIRSCPGADTSRPGGDWGWVEPDSLRPELAAVLKRTPARGVSEIIETPDAVYLAMVEAREAGGAKPFEEVYPELERRLREQEGERLTQAWLGDLRKRSHVVVLDADLF